jgi:hypothetical protein
MYPQRGRIPVRESVLESGDDAALADPRLTDDGDNPWVPTAPQWSDKVFEMVEFRAASDEVAAGGIGDEDRRDVDDPVGRDRLGESPVVDLSYVLTHPWITEPRNDVFVDPDLTPPGGRADPGGEIDARSDRCVLLLERASDESREGGAARDTRPHVLDADSCPKIVEKPKRVANVVLPTWA